MNKTAATEPNPARDYRILWALAAVCFGYAAVRYVVFKGVSV